MKKSLLTLTVMLVAAALIVVFCGPAAAKVTGVCSNCHTMHDSQGGDPMAAGGPHPTLLMYSCVGCHSDGIQTQISGTGGCPTPVVNYTGGEPANYLAGGNFYWVADLGGNDDAKGHNVLGISGSDTLSIAPGEAMGCGNSCHLSLATPQTAIGALGSGCEGCHHHPAHHADDSAAVVGENASSTDGYYRFLSGHINDTIGVCGMEDGDWQATATATDHNEYLGSAGNFTSSGGFSSNGHTMTGFCCGCHGNFHQEQNASAEWIRHPSDAVIPNTGEYSNAYGASHEYDPLVPAARPSLNTWTDPVATVAIGADMVMCLSCHRPHGSPYPDLLRWDYLSDCDAGGPSGSCGCMRCHTQKGT